MSHDWPALAKELSGMLGQLRGGIPEVMKGFSALAKAAGTEGALDAKTKELIALGIAIAARCDGCIAFHTKALVKLGATEAEVHETLGVAIYMGGGPSAMYASNAVAAFNEFSALAHNAVAPASAR